MNKLIALFAFVILAGCAGRTTVEKIVTVTETDTVLVDCLMVGGIIPVKVCSLIGNVVVVLTDCETPCEDVLDQMPDGCYVGETSLPEGTEVEYATLCPFDEDQPLLEGPYFLVAEEEACPLVEDRFVPCDSLGEGEEDEPLELLPIQIGFTTALHGESPFPIEPSANDVIMGSVFIHNPNPVGSTITLPMLLVDILVADDPAFGYSVGTNGVLNAWEHVTSCSLRTWPIIETVAGPAEVPMDGTMLFQNVRVPGGGGDILDIVCSFNNQEPIGDRDGFAVSPRVEGSMAKDEFEIAVPVIPLGEEFGGPDENDPPRVAAILLPHSAPPVFTLASGSPSGFGVPGTHLILRINVSAPVENDIDLFSITFKVNAFDNAETGWSTNLQEPTAWRFNRIGKPEQLDDDQDWFCYTDVGTECGPDDLATYLTPTYMTLSFGSSGPHGIETIPAGDTITYELHIDTTGASSSLDDAVRVDIPGHDEFPFGVSWSTPNGVSHDSAGVNNLPIYGGTTTY